MYLINQLANEFNSGKSAKEHEIEPLKMANGMIALSSIGKEGLSEGYTLTFTTISKGFGNFNTLPESTIEQNAEFDAKFKKAHADLCQKFAENLDQ